MTVLCSGISELAGGDWMTTVGGVLSTLLPLSGFGATPASGGLTPESGVGAGPSFFRQMFPIVLVLHRSGVGQSASVEHCFEQYAAAPETLFAQICDSQSVWVVHSWP
jgi:hypothetical protein